MKTTLIALTCSLVATACANSDNRSQPGPSSAGEPGEVHRPASENNTSAGRASTMAPDKPAELVADAGAFDQTKNADNTKINERDRSALTPMNQGNSAPETDVTAAIRRGVMSDRTLSFTAKNVKIITVGDKVTLRGPVQSERERSVIESLARNTAGVAEVDDQIEVKRQADSK